MTSSAPDRWDYLYSFAPGGEEQEWRRIILHFEDDLLARIEGDLPPADAVPPEPQPAKVVRVPPRPPEKGFFGRIFPGVGERRLAGPGRRRTRLTPFAVNEAAARPFG